MSGLEKRAKRIFGTMPEFVPWDTAWLLSDGSWLRRGRGREGAAHHDMARTILDTQCGGHCVEDFTNATDAIRITQSMRRGRHGIEVVSSTRLPTAEQLEGLHQLCGPSGQPLDGWGRCFGYVHCGRMSWQHTGMPYEPGATEGRAFHFDGGLREIADAMERCRL